MPRITLIYQDWLYLNFTIDLVIQTEVRLKPIKPPSVLDGNVGLCEFTKPSLNACNVNERMCKFS